VYDLLMNEYPFPPQDLTALVERFSVTHVVMLKAALGCDIHFSITRPPETVFEHSDYLVWRVHPSPEGSAYFGRNPGR
jgi:hypothetical protein